MHDDERRDHAGLDEQLLAEFVSDPQSLRVRFEGLRARDRVSRDKLKDADKNARELKQLRKEKQELTRKLGSANSALDAYRAETARLKGDLRRVRGSRAYRLGRTITSPMGLVRSRPAPPAPKQLTSAPHPPAAPAGHSVTAPTAPAPERRLSDYSFEELVERFHDQQTPVRLGHVLSRAWYERGLVSVPSRLLAEHPEAAAGLDTASAELAQRILGADRVTREGLSIPPRAQGPAYLPEPGRVLYCVHSTPAYNTNGYSVRTKGVASGLRQAGADVAVVARSGYPWDSKADVKPRARHRHAVEVDGVDYVHLPGNPLASTPVDRYILECADAFVREARLQRPSVIQAASNFRVGLAALIAARRLGIPFVYEVRGLWEVTEASDKLGWEESERYALQSGLETAVASEADAVLAITEQTRDELVRRGVPAHTITVAPNAVTPHEFLPLPRDVEYAATLGVRTDVPVVGFAGSMVPYEGLEVLVDAAALLRDAGVGFQVVVAGSGSATASLKEQVDRLELGDHVRLVGRVPGHQMPRLLSLFDIMPCPRLSLPVTEMVSPLKPLEAMSSAKAVVLSDVAPHRDIAGPDQSRALLFRAGDPEALADVLRRLVEQPDLRADLGRAGRLWCLDERTWEGLAGTVLGAHRAASSAHVTAAAGDRGRELATLRVGLVADEFTTSTLSASVQVVPLDREGWQDQLEDLDLVFIESAWSGNHGTWHRGVGRYSDEEHADVSALLARARELGVPSVFWNKEDPVHFDRFVATASLCDHVFTTDGSRVLPYLAAGVGTVRTASSLPFYAQPKIHNPLPGARAYEPTVAYAGTFYGERYAKRSAELTTLLETCRSFGLAIYDRQAVIPDSPYRFPPAFRSSVRGSLPYGEVIDSYKSHLANLNVNSVTESPSMFSRRVVEVAACGGVVLSGPGRGIDETFGSVIPTSNDPAMWRTLLRLWSNDPQARLAEAWLQMRAVLRSHSVDTALTIVARTAGIPVAAPDRPSYAVVLDSSAPDVLRALAQQSVPPAVVFVHADRGAAEVDVVTTALAGTGAAIRTWDGWGSPAAETPWIGRLSDVVGRTHFEDLLHATAFGRWDRIDSHSVVDLEPGRPLAEPTPGPGTLTGLVAAELAASHHHLDDALRADDVQAVRLLVPHRSVGPVSVTTDAAATSVPDLDTVRDVAPVAGRRILVAGHDLKFAASLIDELRAQGAQVLIDEWQSHTTHDEQRSLELLDQAEVVLCEWALGNAVWYSQHVLPGQRLVVRVHSQELRRPHLAQVAHENVDAYVFVGELVRTAAVASHGLPADKCVVVPNPVDTAALALPKTEEADTTIGLVGIVPATKRLDLALDLVEELASRGHAYRLRVKGRTPQDYPWMAARPDEMAWYETQYARIDALNAERPGTVVFDGHGDDMPQWYTHIGVALSVSDFESFHLTIADGAASGALPAVLAWPGSDLVYPRDWISATVSEVADRIITEARAPEDYRTVATDNFEKRLVLHQLVDVLAPRTQS